MSTHNICFHGEIRKIFTGYLPLSRPVQGLMSHVGCYLRNILYGMCIEERLRSAFADAQSDLSL